MNTSNRSRARSLFSICVAGIAVTGVTSALGQLKETVLHSFTGGTDGRQPYVTLVQANDGSLYGTTFMAGANNAGIVFKINPDGSSNTSVYPFEPNKVGPGPLVNPSGLCLGADGALYGTTSGGGTNGMGSVFRINPDGTGHTIIHNFDRFHPYGPMGGVVQASDGMLYGTANYSVGGSSIHGSIFKISTNGDGYADLYVFGANSTIDPQNPQSALIVGADGALYGTSASGGITAISGASGYGTVFKVNTDGTGFSILHNFLTSGGDGQRPQDALVQGPDGALYGTTQEGGSFADGGSSGFGTIFKLSPDGLSFTILHNFDPASGDGKYPSSTLTLGNDGALYGLTQYGGSNNVGTLYKINTDGTDYSVLYHFGSSTNDGKYPKAPLIRATDGGLFGTTQFGGDQDFGTIFRIGPAPAILSSVRGLPDKNVAISLQSAPHFAYRIEASMDQIHWTALTNMVNTTGTMQFTDKEASTLSRRFYRAAWVP